VAVVVATRNRAARLAALLESLRRQAVDRARIEVVVVDEASTDGTRELLEREAARDDLALRVVHRERPEGPAAARNDGWRAARAPIVAFTDDDCEASPHWLEAGLAACARHPGAIVQGRTLPMPDELDRLGPFSRTLRIERAGPFYETCNIFYPRAWLERLGGFDAAAFPYPGGEDTDLGWRALEAGATVEYEPEALVHHAVQDHGPVGLMRVALRWSPAMQTLRRHPALRAEVLSYGVFWKRSHALLLAALAGLALSRRTPAALALGIPYLRELRARSGAAGAGPGLAGYFALHDLVETYATLRGAVAHRVLVI